MRALKKTFACCVIGLLFHSFGIDYSSNLQADDSQARNRLRQIMQQVPLIKGDGTNQQAPWSQCEIRLSHLNQNQQKQSARLVFEVKGVENAVLLTTDSGLPVMYFTKNIACRIETANRPGWNLVKGPHYDFGYALQEEQGLFKYQFHNKKTSSVQFDVSNFIQQGFLKEDPITFDHRTRIFRVERPNGSWGEVVLNTPLLTQDAGCPIARVTLTNSLSESVSIYGIVIGKPPVGNSILGFRDKNPFDLIAQSENQPQYQISSAREVGKNFRLFEWDDLLKDQQRIHLSSNFLKQFTGPPGFKIDNRQLLSHIDILLSKDASLNKFQALKNIADLLQKFATIRSEKATLKTDAKIDVYYLRELTALRIRWHLRPQLTQKLYQAILQTAESAQANLNARIMALRLLGKFGDDPHQGVFHLIQQSLSLQKNIPEELSAVWAAVKIRLRKFDDQVLTDVSQAVADSSLSAVTRAYCLESLSLIGEEKNTKPENISALMLSLPKKELYSLSVHLLATEQGSQFLKKEVLHSVDHPCFLTVKKAYEDLNIEWK